MLYQVLKRTIERGDTAGLGEKIDIFFAVGHLTGGEYQELLALLEGGGASDEGL